MPLAFGAAFLLGFKKSLETQLNIVKGVFNFIGTAAKFLALSLLKIGSIIVGAVAGALMGFAGAMSLATRRTIEYARSIALIRANTGLNLNQSARTASQFGAFGISPSALAGMLSGVQMLPALFRRRANMYGLPGYEDPDFLSRTASRYQDDRNSGLGGQLRADAMLKSLGLDNDDIRLIVNLPPEKIRAQQAFQSNLSSQYGLSPDVLKRYAEDVPLAMNRLGSVIQAFVQRVATAALPALERSLTILQNVGLRVLPVFARIFDDIAAYLETHKTDIEDRLVGAVMWVFKSMPILILTGLISFTKGVGAVVSFFGSAVMALSRIIPPLSRFFDFVINSFKSLILAMVPAVRLTTRLLGTSTPSGRKRLDAIEAWASVPSSLASAAPDRARAVSDAGAAVVDFANGPVNNIVRALTGTRDSYDAYWKSIDVNTASIAASSQQIAANTSRIERLRDIAIGLNNYVAESGYNAAFT